MTTRLAALEVVQVSVVDDLDDICHLVCHCSDDNTSACGLDVTGAPWRERDDEPPCPLCYLAWPDDAPCPWGCVCEDCGPVNTT